MPRISTAIFLCAAALIGFYCYQNKNSKTPDVINTSTLVMGIASGYAPFISTNAQGDYEGFDIDVARAVAHELNKNLILKDLGSMTSLLVALDQGSVDAVIWGLSITPDRLKKIEMVHYQGEETNSYPLIFWENIPEGINSLSDMKNMTICAEPGSCQMTTLEKYGADLTILPTERIDDALLNIQYGKAAAAFIEPAIAQKFKRAYPNDICILDIPLAVEDRVHGVGIGVKKENDTLKKEIQQAVDSLKENGTITQAQTTWGIS